MLKWFETRLLTHLAAAYQRRGLDEFQTLMRVGQIVYPDYKYRWPEMDWLSQPEFWDYIARHDDIRGLNADRKWGLAQLFRLCVDLPGDTAECGVYRGASSLLICEAIRRNGKTDKKHFLFDSYEGVSEPDASDSEYWTKGDLSSGEDEALATLNDYRDFVVSYGGWIPERFTEISDRQFCFVHIDVDLHQPTRDSFEFFYPRMVEGGIILCDDYGFSTCPGATRACDEAVRDKPEAFLALAGGGGFMVKGARTAEPGPYLAL